MEDHASVSGSRSLERLEEAHSAENYRPCIRSDDGPCNSGPSENEVDYLRLSVEAMERVQKLTKLWERDPRLVHLNEAQCRVLAEALSEAVQTAREEIQNVGLEVSRLCGAPVFRELCRVSGDCEKLVQDCCKNNWLATAILLADSREDFLLRVSELKWCTKALRTVLDCGSQGGAWLEQFHKRSDLSVADRRTDIEDETKIVTRLEDAAEKDLDALLAKLAEHQSESVDKEMRDLAGYVLSRCKMTNLRLRDYEQVKNLYELSRSGSKVQLNLILSLGAFAKIQEASWVREDFAAKVLVLSPDDCSNGILHYEVETMTKICSHPRIVRFLGVATRSESDSNAIVMELMSSDLRTFIEQRQERDFGRGGGPPFPLHVSVDVMLQVAEGVEVLHNVKVAPLYHRDLTPANILVEPVEIPPLRQEGYVRVKLADFILTEPRSNTFGDKKTGTTKFMAPEIGSGSGLKLVYPAKADAFSFAILCSEILSGAIPFPKLPLKDHKEHMQNGGRPKLPAGLPSQLASLVQRCWNKEPSKRPSFSAICKELRYIKFLITVGGEMQFRALDGPVDDPERTAEIVRNHLRWIDHSQLEFKRLIGSGGFGSVTECEWRGKRVAVKNLIRNCTKQRLEQEAALLKRVKHPNVVKLFGCAYNEEKDKCMIVMELMDQDLHSLIKANMRTNSRPFALPVALEIMLKVATAMKHIRNCNVLHRDLKTTNILVNVRTGSHHASIFGKLMSRVVSRITSSERACTYDVKLADFGLGKYKLGDANFTTRASEARFWLAPEQLESHNYSWPVDVFSFGVVCYEILSGEKPFRGMKGPELRKSVLEGKRPELPEYCPKKLSELVNECWATDPKKRPTFTEVCAQLEACIVDFWDTRCFGYPLKRVQWYWGRLIPWWIWGWQV